MSKYLPVSFILLIVAVILIGKLLKIGFALLFWLIVLLFLLLWGRRFSRKKK